MAPPRRSTRIKKVASSPSPSAPRQTARTVLRRSTRRIANSPSPNPFVPRFPSLHNNLEPADADSAPKTFSSCLTEAIGGSGMLPTMFDGVVASSTRDLTQTEQVYTPDQQLQWLASGGQIVNSAKDVFHEHHLFNTFLNRVVDEADKEEVKFMRLLHPSSTSSGLPHIIHSEADTTSHINSRLVWPMVHVLQHVLGLAAQAAGIPLETPYVASCHGKRGAGTPDAILVYKDQVCGIGEWKTANAMPEAFIETVVESLQAVEESNLGVPVRFWWGNQDNHGPTDALFRKAMCQVFGQMQSRPNVKVACLSSFDTTVFLYRHPEKPNFLFISEAISSQFITVMDFMAMFALALGITELKPEHIPQMNRENWDCLKDYYRRYPQLTAGLDHRRDEMVKILQEHRQTLDQEAARSNAGKIQKRTRILQDREQYDRMTQ
ncbi:hypothetical protein EUX98_g6066 [Antrodiella citrinella]|uniref:Uncharacterized protein n=1 Tax=Antrodiella citrinella TaxID=2447956 RepID=A0A4V3XI74_9APHY|nr:hypothetical protein EUX98_g6066 [Antrodiella citrinella]